MCSSSSVHPFVWSHCFFIAYGDTFFWVGVGFGSRPTLTQYKLHGVVKLYGLVSPMSIESSFNRVNVCWADHILRQAIPHFHYPVRRAIFSNLYSNFRVRIWINLFYNKNSWFVRVPQKYPIRWDGCGISRDQRPHEIPGRSYRVASYNWTSYS